MGRAAAGDFLPGLMLLTVCAVTIAIAAPLAVILWLSWTTGSPADADFAYGWQNYASVFADERTWRVLLNTLGFSALTLAVSLCFGLPAAWLVEHAGFPKGYNKGAAGISRRHALAIVNRGGATAAEIIALKNEIQAGVFHEFGIELCPEPVMVGF
jgi:UDP-N-acetylenolpyruvoylglucosamine reductase